MTTWPGKSRTDIRPVWSARLCTLRCNEEPYQTVKSWSPSPPRILPLSYPSKPVGGRGGCSNGSVSYAARSAGKYSATARAV